jgi:undecaprenyl-diphosphatase
LMLSISFILLSSKRTTFIGSTLFILGLISGTARVYSGLHFPLDILGSIMVSFVSSLIVLKLTR